MPAIERTGWSPSEALVQKAWKFSLGVSAPRKVRCSFWCGLGVLAWCRFSSHFGWFRVGDSVALQLQVGSGAICASSLVGLESVWVGEVSGWFWLTRFWGWFRVEVLAQVLELVSLPVYNLYKHETTSLGYWTILDLNLPPFSRYPTSWTWNDTTCNQAGRELKAVLNDLQWFSMQPLWRQVVACDESLWIPGSGRLTVQQSILGARFDQPSRRAATCGPIHCFRNLWTQNSGRTGAYSPVGDTRSASSGTDEEAKLGCKGRKRVVSCFRSWKLGASVRIFALALVEPSSSSKQGAFNNDLFRWLRVSQGQEFPPWPLQTKNSIICNVENANAK